MTIRGSAQVTSCFLIEGTPSHKPATQIEASWPVRYTARHHTTNTHKIKGLRGIAGP